MRVEFDRLQRGLNWKLATAITAATIAAVCVTFEPAAFAANEPQSGLWRLTSKTERAGVVKVLEPVSRCITPQQAKDAANFVPRPIHITNESCRHSDEKKTANGKSWRTICTGAVQLESDVSYALESSQRFTAQFRTTSVVARKMSTSTYTVEAQRIGDCPR